MLFDRIDQCYASELGTKVKAQRLADNPCRPNTLLPNKLTMIVNDMQ